MPVSYSWYDEGKTILQCHLTGRWTWAEYHQAFSTSGLEMVNSISHAMVTMYTSDNPDYVPPQTLSQIMSINRMGVPKHLKGTFIVGMSMFAQSMIGALGRVNNRVARRYVFAANLETAIPLIRQRLQEERGID